MTALMSARTTSRLAQLLALAALVALSACSTNKADKPMKLVKITNRMEVKRVWTASMGGEKPKLRLGLGVVSDGERVFAASYKGTVEAFDLRTGRREWEHSVRAPLSGGPGASDGVVAVGSSKGEVIAMSEASGAELWRVRVNGEILSEPVIGGGEVLVRTVDGKLHALGVASGAEDWVTDQQVPRLSLRGTPTPTIAGDLAICGFDNGRVAAVTLRGGTAAWDVAVAQARGSNELKRLIDVDARVIAAGDDLFAVAYQGRLVRLARETGQVTWGRDLSSYRGLTVDGDAVYVATSEGELVRLDRSTGTEQWRQKSLLRRMLSAPVEYNNVIVVADIDGVVHFIDRSSGNFLARTSAGGRVSASPIVAGGMVLTFSDKGEISAFRTSPAG
jgi:outer membrane protein assembly factor BamB